MNNTVSSVSSTKCNILTEHILYIILVQEKFVGKNVLTD